MSIYESMYKDQVAFTIESDNVLAQFLPLGAKMCSLVYKPLDLELLVHSPGEEYRLEPYDGDYSAGECSGFDDMFPTIDECYYETYPWKGTRIPDHGEVWSIPWDQASEEAKLHFSVYGVRFPYQLEKWVRFTEANVLRIDYRVTNHSASDFDFMWAAHVMLYLEDGARLVLPPGIESVVSTLSFSGDLGRYGDEFEWPSFELPDGRPRDLSRLRSRTAKDAEKYFVKGRLPEGWCALTYPESDLTLGLAFPVEPVPYLAILPNECGWGGLYNIFLEPATASYDRLDVSRLHHEFSTVKAKSSYEWHLNLAISEGTSFRRVAEDGHTHP